MPNKQEYLAFIADWLSPLGEITARRMFGGHAMYCEGIVFALIADNVLYLKVDDSTRPRFEALGLPAFQPFKDGRMSVRYCQAPPAFFEDVDVMQEWGRAAVEVSRRTPAKKPRKKSRSGLT